MRLAGTILVALSLLLAACGTRGQVSPDGAHDAGTPATSTGALAPQGLTPEAALTRPPQPPPPGGTTILVPPATAPPPAYNGLPIPAVEAASILVFDDASATVLYERDAHRRLPPASLTKMATAILVLQAGDIDRAVTVNPDIGHYLELDASTMGLEPGDRFSIRDLLYGMLLPSAADAADILAAETAGSIGNFVTRMNGLAGVLGLQDTHFIDPHGIGGPGHYSSAYDLVFLARYAMTFDTFRQIVGTESYVAHGSRDLELLNNNPLLGYTPGVDGVKTGFTEEAGKTFVVSAVRDGHRIYVVMLDAPDRAFDAIALIDWAFAAHNWGPPVSAAGGIATPTPVAAG